MTIDQGDILQPQTQAERRRRRLSIVLFILIALVVLYGVSRVLLPFITPIILGALVVTLTFGLYERVCRKLKDRPNASALVMLLGITLVLVIPALLMILLLVQEANSLVDQMKDADVSARLSSINPERYLGWVKRFVPSFDPSALNIRGMIIGIVRGIPGFVAQYGGKLLGGLVGLVVGFVLMLLASFLFYTDGKRFVQVLVSLSPFPDEFDREILKKFDDVINATFRGQVLTALAQGVVTGIGLAIAGIPGSIFWGAVAAVFSLLPMVGAAAVWIPSATYLFVAAGAKGEGYGMAIFLVVWGVAVVSTVDNFIRPWAMKGRTDMSAIMILFSILGGISAFGFIGLVLGPLLFALVSTVIRIYQYLYRDALKSKHEHEQSVEVQTVEV
ncbi:MAG TPA: AI-2E family transporter [Thermoanaerobaculia bacterium]|nr:AI-2E family transporter [Thermoanaerobaculia bacterium]